MKVSKKIPFFVLWNELGDIRSESNIQQPKEWPSRDTLLRHWAPWQLKTFSFLSFSMCSHCPACCTFECWRKKGTKIVFYRVNIFTVPNSFPDVEPFFYCVFKGKSPPQPPYRPSSVPHAGVHGQFTVFTTILKILILTFNPYQLCIKSNFKCYAWWVWKVPHKWLRKYTVKPAVTSPPLIL